MSESTARRNRLAGETSPYLLQHAHNPVDWYPWGEAALDLARESGKPILLSIGYSACHWCHVMAHESFEDEETAKLMNQHFVNVKVDREERPDIDRIYQLSHQLLTQRAGGWPLTMFLTPDDQTPFFGGTYFPPAPRYGMPSFKELLLRVVDFLAENGAEVKQQNAALRDALAKADGAGSGGGAALEEGPLRAARHQLESLFDSNHGGFGSAPKFPHATNIERLLRDHGARVAEGSPDQRGLHIATHTLRKMARGGIHDHLGGGFCRYSVDEEWMIPHFEKMLYDNGPLLALYAEAWQITGEPLFEEVARGIASWVIREMQSPAGGYYSTLDADSEGEEGKFYVWSPDQVRALLTPQEARVLARVYGLDAPANFEGRHWHLHTFVEPAEAARALELGPGEVDALLASARRKLFEAREPRVRPARDEKILTSWNALMIQGMTTASKILDEPSMLASAERALAFIKREMWRDGRLLATHKDGRSHLPAYLDDYAFLIDALLNLLSARWSREDLELAIELAEVLMTHFADAKEGGFYFTADDHEQLIHRSKSFMDDALPAGNGVAARGLLRLGHLLGETRYLDAAEHAVRTAWEGLARVPHAHNAMLGALEEVLRPTETIVLRGDPEPLEAWRRRALSAYAPRRLVVPVAADEADLPGMLDQRRPRGPITAYVCQGHHCEAPVSDPDAFDALLAPGEVPRADG